MTVFYTADLHLNHRNIGPLCNRPWGEDVRAMNAAIIQAWNDIVAPGDVTWILGDFSLSPRALEYVPALNGTKILVAGNHDACWTRRTTTTGKSKARRMISRYLDAGFAEVYDQGVVDEHTIGDHRVRLAHLPYYGDSGHDERYADRRPVDDGLPLICGHVHSTWARPDGGEGRVRGRQINVGVDVWEYRPVAAEDLVPMIDALPA